ncbi:MAG: hypothetical protein IH845_05085 [Nanoarchaeota archaeon]|nr:hypothetical protein [Nanoarchaeota archaeon]
MRKQVLLMYGLIALVVMSFSLVSANSGSSSPHGSIWTTTSLCGEESQDVNHYNLNESVYINGENFEEGSYDWTVSGLGGSKKSRASCDPFDTVATGTYSVNSSGDFCFEAYTVALDDCGEYRVKFDNKKDNFRVNTEVVPEFGTIIGMLTILSAAGIFFVVRRE